MSHPFFSIVIPTLNEEKFLPRLLKDIRSQLFTRFEVIVVDGNSSDNTAAIVKKCSQKDTRFALLSSTKRNVSLQRNLGARKAHGEYIVFFDADNQIEDHFFDDLSKKLIEFPCDSFTVYAQPDSVNPKDQLFMRLQNTIHELGATMKNPFAFGACIGCKRDAFLASKGFNPRISYMEDSEFVQKLVKLGYTFRFLREPTFIYSLRRFRKEGNLKLLRKAIPIVITNILKNSSETDAYPMLGGAIYTQEEAFSKQDRLHGYFTSLQKNKMIRPIAQELKKLLTSFDI